jgi:outer membrane protein assembly factor BamB
MFRALATAVLFMGRMLPAADSWPALHGDNSRSGWYDSFPALPLKLTWHQDLSAELTGPRAEVIVAQGLSFMGSYAGKLRASDAATGAERWAYDCGGPVGHSPAWSGGRLFVASMGGLHCLDAAGKRLWQAKGEAGFWTAPVVAGEMVMAGDRAGVFHAWDLDGHEKWTVRTEAPILTPASVDGDRVVFASEDMKVRCCRLSDGQLFWTSRQLPGLTLRDYAPCITGGLVFITSCPVQDFHAVLRGDEEFLTRRTGFQGKDRRFIPGTPGAVEKEQAAILDRLKARPDLQTFFSLRLSDGTEPWTAPILYTAGCHDPMTPPCVDRSTGEVFVILRSAYGVWDGGGEVCPNTCFGSLDLATGRVKLVTHSYPSKDPARPPGAPDTPWGTFNYIGDETQALSCAPNLLFSNHQGFTGLLDRRSGLITKLWGERDTYAGFYGPRIWGYENQGGPAKAAAAGKPYALINEWHGPARSIVSVAAGRVYYHSGGQILCLTSAKAGSSQPGK